MHDGSCDSDKPEYKIEKPFFVNTLYKLAIADKLNEALSCLL